MSNHRVSYLGSGEQNQARCSCKQKSPIGSRGDAESWFFGHMQEVERIRAHLGTRNPSLKSQLAWFKTQADDVTNSVADREIWRQLADELERHITAQVAVTQTETLF